MKKTKENKIRESHMYNTPTLTMTTKRKKRDERRQFEGTRTGKIGEEKMVGKELFQCFSFFLGKTG